MNSVPLEQLSAGHFAKLTRTTFQVLVEPKLTESLELVAVIAPGRSGSSQSMPGGTGFESFSLLFAGPAERPLAQRTYRFSHERLGSFDLFIVPVGADGNARQYEAVFNRRVPPEAPANSA